MVNKHTERWQVFTEVQFKGDTVTLEPGGKYKDTEVMQLKCPVKSFRKAPSDTSFLSLNNNIKDKGKRKRKIK